MGLSVSVSVSVTVTVRVKVECVSVSESQGVTHKIFVSSGGYAKVKLCRELSRLALHRKT